MNERGKDFSFSFDDDQDFRCWANMASDLTFGAVPPFYREVYECVSGGEKELQIDRDSFVKLLAQSALPIHVLTSIWESVDTKQGYLTRIGLYKALALVAIAQQGKQINEKVLQTFSGQELPKPQIGELTELKDLSAKLRREKNPTQLGMTFQEIRAMDIIIIELVPEKKGLFLKHVEYEISSERQRTKVRRRFKDFVALHELLLFRFPYRSIPRLPPKKMMGGDAEFIEDRRRALKRYLTLICRHPTMAEDQIVNFFLSFNGQDAQTKMRENFRNVPDEYVVSDLALRAKDLVPLDTQIQFAHSREQIRQLHSSVSHMKDIIERLINRTLNYSHDMQEFGKELITLSADKAESSWITGTTENWFRMKKMFRNLNNNFTLLSLRLKEQATKQEAEIMEELNLLVDLLTAYNDLCDRHEKGVQNDHQRALSKMTVIKKKLAMNSFRGPNLYTTDQIESRIAEHENQILNMENRNYFSLHCIHMETQFVHTNMELLHEILQSLADMQTDGESELSALWEQFIPTIANTFPQSSKSPATSRPTSPIQDI